MLSVAFYYFYADCRYADCRYAEFYGAFRFISFLILFHRFFLQLNCIQFCLSCVTKNYLKSSFNSLTIQWNPRILNQNDEFSLFKFEPSWIWFQTKTYFEKWKNKNIPKINFSSEQFSFLSLRGNMSFRLQTFHLQSSLLQNHLFTLLSYALCVVKKYFGIWITISSEVS
jgi:hypothetical protein